MKIAFFHELHKGGARRASNEYSKYLKENNSVDLYIADEKRNHAEDIFYSEVYFYEFIPKEWSGKKAKTKIYKDSVELIKLNSLHKKIAKDIDSKGYDIVLVFPSKLTQAPFILKYLKTPYVYFAMEALRLVYDPRIKIPEDIDKARLFYEKLNRKIRKRIDYSNINHAENIIGPSRYSSRISEKIYKKKLKVAYLGVDNRFFTPGRNIRNIDILFVGSTDQVNGYDLFLEIKKNLKSGSKVREVLFEKEWLNDKHIKDLYKKTKILVATSRSEPLGIIPLEAMACGVVVLAIDEGGYRETIIDGKNGYLLDTPPEFNLKINDLLKDQKKIKEMSAFAIKNIDKKWSWKATTQKLEKILQESLTM